MTSTETYTLTICTECGTGHFADNGTVYYTCRDCGQMIHASDLTPEWDERIVITEAGLLASITVEPTEDDD